MPWRRRWQPPPVLLPGESQGQGSLVGCRLRGRPESDTPAATWQQQQEQRQIGVKCRSCRFRGRKADLQIRRVRSCESTGTRDVQGKKKRKDSSPPHPPSTARIWKLTLEWQCEGGPVGDRLPRPGTAITTGSGEGAQTQKLPPTGGLRAQQTPGAPTLPPFVQEPPHSQVTCTLSP